MTQGFLQIDRLSKAFTPAKPVFADVSFTLDKGEFVGRRVLAQQAADGPAVRLLAFRMTGKCPPPRAHYPVVYDGQRVGEITSGTLSPMRSSCSRI